MMEVVSHTPSDFVHFLVNNLRTNGARVGRVVSKVESARAEPCLNKGIMKMSEIGKTK